jgi:predicted nuclease of predicted toxin-antitoxin system
VIRLLADENLDNRIISGLRRRLPALEIVRAQDTHLRGQADEELLRWCADHNYVLVTHDVNTIPAAAANLIEAGTPSPGIILVPLACPLANAIEDLLLIGEVSEPEEWREMMRYLPL